MRGAPSTANRPQDTDVRRLYELGARTTLWLDPSGRPTSDARDAMTLLADAAADGLNPAEYDADRLNHLALSLDGGHACANDAVTFDIEMSANVLRFLRHLHVGRIDPRALGFRLSLPPDAHDFPKLLHAALADHRIQQLAAELAPPLGQYRALRSMLSRYRRLAADESPASIPVFTKTVKPGELYADLATLQQRLAALGDLFAGALSSGTARYDGPIVEAVQRFQRRHGLDEDGILGPATQAALRVPLAWRVRQIELALERLRWLPDVGDRRLIALNTPMFHLWGWDAIEPDGEPSIGMRAIVGRALRTQTPVFAEEMRSVIFRPYWNVPRSILRGEILPILERDPGYLQRHGFEIVRGQGDAALPLPATAETITLLKQGALRLRQRPGPQNALGLVKFVFPNNENVYMHGTPAQALFSHARRDFSHGCVRVEDPVALARWVLSEEPEWDLDAILAAMAGPSSGHVTLSRPIQVILFYTTAVVMPEDGTVRFADDIYRHDVKLDRALLEPQTN